MSAEDRRVVRDSSDDHPLHRGDASIQPSRETRVVNGSNADDIAPSP